MKINTENTSKKKTGIILTGKEEYSNSVFSNFRKSTSNSAKTKLNGGRKKAKQKNKHSHPHKHEGTKIQFSESEQIFYMHEYSHFPHRGACCITTESRNLKEIELLRTQLLSPSEITPVACMWHKWQKRNGMGKKKLRRASHKHIFMYLKCLIDYNLDKDFFSL